VSASILFVRSSAGSGKTHHLALRYIRLLLETGGDSSTIVAITFTNKAAREMRERLLEIMKSIVLDLPFCGMDPLDMVGCRSKAEREKAKRVVERSLERIFRDYWSFNVGTIDSLVNLILQASMFRLDLPHDSEIAEDTSSLRGYVLDSLIQGIVDDEGIRAIFDTFLERYLEIEGENPSWYPRRILGDILSLLWEEEWKENKPFAMKQGEDPARLRARIMEVMEALEKAFEGSPSVRLGKVALSAIKSRNFRSNCFTKGLEECLLKGSASLDQRMVMLWRKLTEELSCYYRALSESKFWPYLEVYKLFKETFFREVNQGRRTIGIEQLNSLLQRIIGSDGFIPEVYYSLSSRYLHFLVDEFQDTNHLQWKNIEVLVEEALDSGGTLFLVGDPKQAIYRFRGGRAELMEEVLEKFRSLGPAEHVLTTNYRSLENIVNFNNVIFSRANLEYLIGEIPGERISGERLLKFYGSSYQLSRLPGGYVRCEMLKDEESCMERLKEILPSIRGYFADGDIAILVRKNSEVRKIVRMLLEMGIRVDSDVTIHVFHNPLVREIIHFLRFLERPDDRLSLIGFLLGDIFGRWTGMERDEILDWLMQNGSGESRDICARLEQDFQEIWPSRFEELKRGTAVLSAYDLIVLFLKVWNIFEMFPEDVSFLLHLLEMAKGMADKGDNSLRAFLRLSEGGGREEIFLLKTKGIEDAVTVMTIHKAKGLEFPCVIVPFARLERPNQRRGRDASRLVVPSRDELRLLYTPKEYRECCPELKEMYKRREEEALFEDLNVLYVAFTRAKRSLYVFLPEGRGNAFARYVFGLKEFSSSRKAEVIEIGRQEAPGPRIEREVADLPAIAAIDVAKGIKERAERSPVSPAASVLSKRRGEVIHRALSLVRGLEGGDLALQLRNALGSALTGLGPEDAREIESTLFRFFSQERIRRFFVLREGERVHTEKEVVDRNGRTFKVDRVVERGWGVEVVEFKTGEGRREEDLKQLSGYVELLREVYGDRPVEGYLIYVEGGEVLKV